MSEAGAHRAPDELRDEPQVVVRDRRKIDPVSGAVREADEAQPGAGDQPAPTAGATDEVASLRTQLAERTADLQRITAEYANYRKRVDRDRVVVVDGATRSVLAMLLPVLDDVERAREHGDLTGAFKAVADQLEGVLEKQGLRPFGSAGDPFDPMLHEAVAHQTSPDVTVPTCAQVLRRGYRHGDRLLRAALVAVVDPEPAPPPTTEPISPSDLPGSTVASGAGAAGESGGAGATGAAGGSAGPGGTQAPASASTADAPGGAGGESRERDETGQPGHSGQGPD